MILTTTPSVEGRSIAEYKGIVFGEVISGVDVIKDFTAGLSNFFGGRSATYEDELTSAREQALQELEQRAARLGADAVVWEVRFRRYPERFWFGSNKLLQCAHCQEQLCRYKFPRSPRFRG